MIQFKAIYKKKKNDRIFLSKPVVTARAWKSLELNSTANSGTTSTITHGPLIIFILRILFFFVPSGSFFFFFFYEQILEPSTVINITGVKQHECLLPSRKVRRKLFQPSAWMLFTVLIHANFNGCSTLDDFPPLFTTPSRKRWNVRSRISHESRAIKGKLLIRKLSRFDQFRFKCCVLIIADV